MPEGLQIRQMFTGIAHRYDFLNHLLSFGLDRYWWRQMAKFSGAREGMLALDVAAGTGDSSVYLARRGAEVISSDFTPAMLALGPEKFQCKGLKDRVWASVGADAQMLPFAEESFDLVTICYGIRNVKNRAKAYGEFKRVLKPGGRLVILEFSRPRFALVRFFYRLYSLKVLPRLGGWISGSAEAYRYLPESIRTFPDQAALADELRTAGFETVNWQNLSFGIAALHIGVV